MNEYDNEEQDINTALYCAEKASARHWPTVAGVLRAEVLDLRHRLNETRKASSESWDMAQTYISKSERMRLERDEAEAREANLRRQLDEAKDDRNLENTLMVVEKRLCNEQLHRAEKAEARVAELETQLDEARESNRNLAQAVVSGQDKYHDHLWSIETQTLRAEKAEARVAELEDAVHWAKAGFLGEQKLVWELEAQVDRMREALKSVLQKSPALRQGGPDPLDLIILSFALNACICVASDALEADDCPVDGEGET